MTQRSSKSISTEIGIIRIEANPAGVCTVEILGATTDLADSVEGIDSPGSSGNHTNSTGKLDSRTKLHLDSAIAALNAYFNHQSDIPKLVYDIRGTDFQRAVWQEISNLGFGESATYGEIAARIGKPKAVRAVGAAVGANPVPLLIGCHRVLGAAGRITGYSGGDGIATKRQLLQFEQIDFTE